jgi:hypothetical protein
MFKALRLKEIILIALTIIFIPSYAFYSRVIAPRFGASRVRSLNSGIGRDQKKLNKEVDLVSAMEGERESLKAQIAKNEQDIVRMRREAEDFKRYILSINYEFELHQYLFGRDARYTVRGLGTNPKRFPKGNYTELVYDYQCQGKFQDIIKMVKKIENTSRSLSISKLTLEKPKQKKEDMHKKDDGTIIGKMEIHVIFSAMEDALDFEEFRRNEPELNLRKIDGNPWDPNFGETRKRGEGPTGPIKRLYLESVLYMHEPDRRAVKFTDHSRWYRIGEEFEIEKGKSFTMARVLFIGGRYVVIKHLNKNLIFKIALNVAGNSTDNPEDTNEKHLVEGANY